MEITKSDVEQTIKVTGKSSTVTYNGSEQTVEGFTTDRTDITVTLKEGKVAKATGTNAGTYYMNLKAEDFEATSSRYSNIKVEVVDGQLTIDPDTTTEKVVTIVGKTDTAKYDGNEHTVEGYTVTLPEDYAESDFKFTGTAKAAGTEAGTYTMGLTAADFENVSKNYTNVRFEVTDGSLEITTKSIIPGDKTGITVTGLENVLYDGQNHKQEPTVTDTKTGKVLVSGTDYTLVYPEDTTNVGTVIITVKGIGNYSDEDIVSYDITKRNVKLTSETAEKPYDGTPLTRPTVKVEGDGFVEGEVDKESIKATGTITNVGGPVDNLITFTTLENFKDGNYTIEQVVGNLTITAKSIEGEDSGLVVEKPADVPYNGKEQKQKPVVKDTKLNTTLVEDTDYTLTYSEDVKNVGTVTVKVIGQGNYSGTLETTYLIIARNVTLTSGSASKEYDGKPLTKAGVVISEDGFVED